MSTNLTLDDLQNLLLNTGNDPVGGSPVSFRPIRPIAPMPIAPVLPVKGLNPKLTSPTLGANPSGKNGIPLQLLTLQAVESPVISGATVACDITVSFTQQPQDTNYFMTNIWFTGYHGSQNPTLMASGNTSPMNFLCDATGETVSVFGQTISSTGMSAPVLFATHTTVTLSGTVGAPPAPTIDQMLVGSPVGYQFSFFQVSLPTGDTEIISNYNVYRGLLNNTSSASLIGTVVPNAKQTGAIVFTDTIVVGTGQAYFYWVSAVNTAKFESTLTPAQSGTVVGSTGSIPPSLSTPFLMKTTTTSVTITTSPSCFFTRSDKTTQMIGSTSQAVTGLTAGNTVFFFPYWNETTSALNFIQATDVVIPQITGVTMLAASAQSIRTTTSGAIPSAFTVELWFKGTVAGSLFDHSAPQTIGTTTSSVCQAIVSAGGEIVFSIYNGSTWSSVATTGAGVLDNTWHHLMCSYGAGVGMVIVDGIITVDNTHYWQNLSMGTIATTTGYWHFGVVAGFAGAPLTTTTDNSFTMSHIALYTTALTYIQAAAHFQAFCNLGPTYYALELTYDGAVNYWKLIETTGTTAADSIGVNTGTYAGSPTLGVVSNVITVLGTPTIAWPYNSLLAIQFQFLKSHVPLSNGAISATIPATGTTQGSGGGLTGGYSGGGGRGGGCFSGNTTLLDGRPMNTIMAGNYVWVQKDSGAHVMRRVGRVLIHQNFGEDMLNMGHGELVTHGHQMRDGSKWVSAETLFKDGGHKCSTVYNLEIDTEQDDERNYILENGYCAHNILKQNQPGNA